jgi:dihydrodipicolinate synthase/N-acetylneuraminate lyase
MLRGILTPLVTPLRDPDTLDSSSLQRLIDHVIEGGVHGIFLLGTTGEGPGLGERLRYQVLEEAVAGIAGRVPLLVNVTGTSFAENVALASAAERLGAKAVVYSGPLYSPVSQPELLAHVERFAARCPLPVILYNMPSHTNVTFDVPTVERLAGSGSVAGLKDSSARVMYLQDLSRALGPQFPLFVGPEELLYPAMISAGVTGGVNGGSNLFPSLYVGLYNAIRAGNHTEAASLHAIVRHVSAKVYSNGYLRGLKSALEASGLCATRLVLEPGVPLGSTDASSIAACIEELITLLSATGCRAGAIHDRASAPEGLVAGT